MSTVASLITDLISAGVSAELVGRVAAALAEREVVTVRDEQAERRREKDRERKRNSRVCGIPQMSAESADAPPDGPLSPPAPPHTPLNPHVPSEPVGSSGPAAPAGAAEGDLKTRIFGEGLNWLAKQSDKPPDKLRPMVGRWCSVHGDGRTLSAFIQAWKEAPVDPVAWIERKLNEGNPNGKAAETDPGKREDRAAQLVARLAARSGAGVVPGAGADADPVLPAVSG